MLELAPSIKMFIHFNMPDVVHVAWVVCRVVCCGLRTVCCVWCVVDYGFRVVVTVCPNGDNNPTTSGQNPLNISNKIYEHFVFGRPGTILVRTSRQGRSLDGHRTSTEIRRTGLLRPLGRKRWTEEIPKIESGTKVARWRQIRHQGPLKTFSRSAFKKH